AGVLGKKADMLPMGVEVSLGKNEPKTFNVRVARHSTLLPSLVFAALSNAVDMEGELPDESTARVEARIELENGRVLRFSDTLSGMSASRAPMALFSPIASAVSQLSHNPFKELKAKRISCTAKVEASRTTADLDAMELDRAVYAPGDTVKATVWLKPWRGGRERVEVSLKLPDDMPEGEHSAIACDGATSARQDVRNHPGLMFPMSAEQVVDSLEALSKARRTALALRVPLGVHGVVSGGKALPTLPGSVAHILASSKRTGALSLTRAAVARKETGWVILGSDTATFTVSKTRR
ncbi:MAG: hypothetical protein K2W96_27330, partial [Gemmataceae bacterium]|nr:hypothetical protein [Gemmataceae bacterium]